MRNNEVVIYIITGTIGFFGLLFAGGELENRRIYNKCLDKLEQMPYTLAREMCKELVK